MVKLSLLGIPHDEYSSFLRGPSEAPPLIRRELVSDAYSIWSETGIDLGAAGTLVEYNPRCDVSNMTATVAAKLLKEIGGMMLKRH